MCFIIDSNHPKVKIAKKDIVCYKLFYNHKKHFESPYRNFKFQKGECYYESKALKITYEAYYSHTIEIGIHSYTNLKKSINVSESWIFSNIIIVKCIIPEGAKYYYNSTWKEYVSDYIIIGTNKDIKKTKLCIKNNQLSQ